MSQEPPTNLLDPKETMSLFPASVKADEISKTHCLFDVETSENSREELKEDERKIKKMKLKYPSNKERKGEKRTGVSTELDLNIPPYTFTKKLAASDIGQLYRLMLERNDAESHILSHLSADDQRRIQEGIGFKLKVYDHDTNTQHDLVLKRMVRSTKSYVINGGWFTEFVKRKGLKEGQELGFFWNATDSRLHIFLLSPTPADQKNLN